MRVVVAGATGFIGTAIGRALGAAGHVVVPLGRELSGERGDALIWAAGRREADLAANRAVHVEAAARAVRAVGASRVVYLSSGECYGAAPVPYREDGPALGTSDYARAKREGEAAVGEGAIALRLGVVYGPGQSPRMLIPQVVEALRAGRRIGLTAGTQTRDFVFVDDVAAAVVAALTSAPAPVVNIGSGREIAVRDVCLALAEVIGAPASLLGFGDLPMRPDEQLRYVLDVERAHQVLGWRATTPLADGLARL